VSKELELHDEPPAPHEPVHGIFTDLGEARIIPPNWVIENLLPVGLTFMAADPKAYKSTVASAMAVMAAGYDVNVLPKFMRHVLKPGNSMVLSAEALAGEIRHDVEKGFFDDTGKPVKIRNDGSILVADDPWVFRLDDPDGQEKMMYWLKELNPRLGIIDPLRDFHQLEEKDSGQMNRLLRPLRQWAVMNDAAIVIVHHNRKPAGEDTGKKRPSPTDMRGTTALFGIADGVLMLKRLHELRAGDDELDADTDVPQIVLNATFKRGKGWTRTLELGLRGVRGSELMLDGDKRVLQMLSSKCTADQVAKQLHLRPETVANILEKLRRNGLAKVGTNKMWRKT
jgi:hypothetical protein